MLAKLRWLTTLSLDAPLVAVAWQALVFRELNTPLHWYYAVIVFLSVWLGYAADRWFDNLRPAAPSSPHHQFSARNSRFLVILWLVTLITAVSISIFCLTLAEFSRGFALMAASLLYTFFAQRGRRFAFYPLIKSTLTGLLILASSLLFLHSADEAPSSFHFAVVVIWLLFTANCLLIRSWTRSAEKQTEKRAIHALLLVLILSLPLLFSDAAGLAWSSLIASVLLLLTNRFSSTMPGDLPRTVADVCLLSPFFVLLLG